MYKMLVLDLDGTLLNEKQQISSQNIKSIKNAIKKGVKIVLASGRSYQGMLPFIKELGLDCEGCYTIACSGAVTIENKKDHVIHEIPLNHKDLLSILNICEDFDLDMSAYTNDSIIVHQDNLFSRYDAVANYTKLQLVDFYQMDQQSSVFKVNLINEDVSIMNKIVNYFPTIQLSSLSMRKKKGFNPNFLHELWRFPSHILENYTIVQPLPFCVEIMNKQCNKSVGVEVVASKYGISREEIVCVGDSGNDIHMIKYAGLGVAMGNAIDQVKKNADVITKTNEEDGVSQVIEEYFL